MDDLTRLPGEATSAGTLTASGTGWGRFAPGTLFAGRFRIVAPLGRGGMGEVYRADDLKLGQTVALKFLPDSLAHDPARLAQFHNEVRIARTISHRNVCRTYDIGDADGRPFLTMEYVDGEDLASLLRRIGRFPQEKAVEVARQICAGVAAAHERGVLHRDLKPANIMIDGDGHVRVTDFGLAALAGSVDNIRSGTPAYMAPEQLAGREVSVRSDIYALGLILYELFTGKRVFEAATLNELLRLHQSDAVVAPSSHVRDLEPTIERAIQRCLDRDPAKRPASALAVSAALPGGDQLAAALAAGETPSPEMVAAAGEQSALQPAIGVALLAFTLAMLVALALVSQRFSIIHLIPFPRSNDALVDRAQEFLERMGYGSSPGDAISGWELNREYLLYARRERPTEPWPALATGRTRTAIFWYRTSPDMMVPSADVIRPTQSDPPLVRSGMRLVRLDPRGRLLEFHSIPPQVDEPSGPAAPPAIVWDSWFDAAGLPRSSFQPVVSKWTPRSDADTREAWEGPLPDMPGTTVRVEGAGYRGRPIYFAVIPPWTEPARMPQARPRTVGDIVSTLAVVVSMVLLVAAVVLARRNLVTGRGDRRGAMRTASVMFVSLGAGLLLRSRLYPLAIEFNRLSFTIAITLYVAATIWMVYLALEPYVRKFWPQLLIGWTRLLAGRFRDPVVGRDVLVGVAAGTIAAMLIASREVVPRLLGWPLSMPAMPEAAILLGTNHVVSEALQEVRRSLTSAMQCVCIVVLMKILLKRPWLVMVASTILLLPIAMNGTFAGEQLALELVISLTGIALIFTVLLRFGLLALGVTFYTFMLTEIFPLTTDFSRPYATASAVLLAGVAAIAVFGFRASRGDEPLFGRPLLD